MGNFFSKIHVSSDSIKRRRSFFWRERESTSMYFAIIFAFCVYMFMSLFVSYQMIKFLFRMRMVIAAHKMRSFAIFHFFIFYLIFILSGALFSFIIYMDTTRKIDISMYSYLIIKSISYSIYTFLQYNTIVTISAIEQIQKENNIGVLMILLFMFCIFFYQVTRNELKYRMAYSISSKMSSTLFNEKRNTKVLCYTFSFFMYLYATAIITCLISSSSLFFSCIFAMHLLWTGSFFCIWSIYTAYLYANYYILNEKNRKMESICRYIIRMQLRALPKICGLAPAFGFAVLKRFIDWAKQRIYLTFYASSSKLPDLQNKKRYDQIEIEYLSYITNTKKIGGKKRSTEEKHNTRYWITTKSLFVGESIFYVIQPLWQTYTFIIMQFAGKICDMKKSSYIINDINTKQDSMISFSKIIYYLFSVSFLKSLPLFLLSLFIVFCVCASIPIFFYVSRRSMLILNDNDIFDQKQTGETIFSNVMQIIDVFLPCANATVYVQNGLIFIPKMETGSVRIYDNDLVERLNSISN